MDTKYKILRELQTLIAYYPNLRFGQLIELIDCNMENEMFYVKDKDFLRVIDKMLEDLE